eukprot:scaffold88891_cov55-Phaeocystis_antarctica.AAC.11
MAVTVVVEARAADRVRAVVEARAAEASTEAEAALAARAAVKAVRAAAIRQMQTWARQPLPPAYRAQRRHPHMQPHLHRRASATRQWPTTRP